MSSQRYQGKPLLRLLECYVLKSLDLLPESDGRNLTTMQPKLAQIYGKQGTWDEIIAATMELPKNMPSLIRDMWARNQEIAKANGVTLTPQQFAEMFVDQNLTS
jgi:hypothetical protein